MIVPSHWAEARRVHVQGKHRRTLARFGWSDLSQADALAQAEARVEEALRRAQAGEGVPTRDPKVPYNGADGLPIREEILAREGEVVITRNSYGARCLNVPDVLFVDVDFDRPASSALLAVASGLMAVVGLATAWAMGFGLQGIGVGLVAGLLVGLGFEGVERLGRGMGRPERRAWARARAFVARHPTWNLRVYRTPAGLRLMATHTTFSARDPEVEACFRALGADPAYARMCRNQRCFRARLTAKPWRIGVGGRLRPRPGVWPVREERRAARAAWIHHYEGAASAFAACRYVESLGSGVVDPRVLPVLTLHDEGAGACSDRPIA